MVEKGASGRVECARDRHSGSSNMSRLLREGRRVILDGGWRWICFSWRDGVDAPGCWLDIRLNPRIAPLIFCCAAGGVD
jgi:hypothetical protein